MPDQLATARRYLGRPVRTRRGVLLGRVSDVLSDAESKNPQWLVVRLRGLVPRHRPLPLQLVLEEEHALVAPISADVLRSAPVAKIATDLRSSQEIGWRRYWSIA